MKIIKIAILATVVAVGIASSAFADLKVAVVNLQTVFQQAPQGQATVDQIKQQLTPQMNQIKKNQAALTTAVNNFNKNAPTMSAKERDNQEAALTKQQQQFQKEVDSFRNTEAQKQQAAAQNFQTSLVSAIQTVAKNGSYDLVMTDQTLPYYNSKMDVSAEVVNLMKKMGSGA